MNALTSASSSRITRTFEKLRAQGRAAFIPYITAGDPDLEGSYDVMCGLAEGGADIIELGVPFSDPMADGEVVQAAMLRALEAGTTFPKVLSLLSRFRENYDTPVVLFGYLNPLYQFGLDRVAKAAATAGADAFLVVDLPPEAAHELVPSLKESGLDFIGLFTPTSTVERLQAIAKVSSGFAYYVSMAGTTGTRLSDFAAVAPRVEEVRAYAKIPVAVGFGIQSTEDAQAVARFADAVVIGSHLVKQLANVPREALFNHSKSYASDYIRALSQL